MSRKGGPPRRTGGEMRFFDETEAETTAINRLGRVDAGVYDEGYGGAGLSEPKPFALGNLKAEPTDETEEEASNA